LRIQRSFERGCAHHASRPSRCPPAQRANFFDTLLARVRGLPGMDAAAFVTVAPGQGYWGDWGFAIVEHPALPQGSGQSANKLWADPKYFATMGIPLLRGRTFDFDKRLDSANEVIVSQSFANQYFPGEDPVGKHINAPLRHHTAEVVGIVGDTRSVIGEKWLPMMYFPLGAGVETVGTLVIRSTHDVQQYALPVERIVAEMDSDLPVSDVLTMNELLGKQTFDQNFNAMLAHSVRNAVTSPGRGRTLWCDVLHRRAADDRNRGYVAVYFCFGLQPPCLRFAVAVTGHHARLGTRLRARLCRGLHFRRLSSMSFQGTTRTNPYVRVYAYGS